MGKPVVSLDEGRTEADALLAASDCIADRDTVAAVYDRMARDIAACYGSTPIDVLCVMSGGLFATAELLKRLSMPIRLDYLHATRYRGGTSGHDLVWKVLPGAALARRHVLLIDDILDEGYTLQAICATLQEQAVASLRVAVLADKRHDRRVAAATADFVGLEVPDRYVFGCGMDVHGYWRQLPEIRALKEDA
ncbi:hypoxanthine-guanine phosphoribosyltransferase [Algiphilus sp.]|uniref:hypoxanthine-guanine phosphoribosyltransferase n=1 Tax=Algiphilus sp. TaxID=1872431 RepID=UPI002A5D878D|nr:hypoxanthine-guanine phosphoribosyltransferase [Pseudomonadota bacterium]